MVAEYSRRCSALSVAENPLGASMHAMVGDLCDPAGVADDLMGKELFEFDLAIVGMGFHHFEHLELSLRRLAERVKKGSVVAIVDLAESQEAGKGFFGADGQHEHGHGRKHEHTHQHASKPEHTPKTPGQPPAKDVCSVFAAAGHAVPHKHGFGRADMEKLFSAAGCTDFDMVLLDEPIVFGDGADALKNKAFIARARRA